VRLQGHHPVDDGEGLGEPVEDHAGGGDPLHAQRQAGIARRVLGHGVPQEEVRQPRPHGEVERGPDQPERRVQERCLVHQQRVVGRVGPVIEVRRVQPDDDRDEQDPDPAQVAGEALGDAAQHHAPAGAGEMLKHREEQAAQRQAAHEAERHEVGPQEALPLDVAAPRDQRGRGEQDEPDDAGRPRDPRGEAAELPVLVGSREHAHVDRASKTGAMLWSRRRNTGGAMLWWRPPEADGQSMPRVN
jgi:hypothetical protein